MSTPTRLPIVNSDDGTWGDILRQYLMQQHYDDGTDNPGVNGGHQNVTIRAGTTTKAPLTFTSGTSLTTPAAGAMEFTTDTLYFTITTGTTRKKVAIYDDSSGNTGDLYYRDSSGNFVRLAMSGTANQVLRSGTTPSWGFANSGFATPAAVTSNTTYNVGTSDTVIFADASSNAITIALPAASGMTGYRFYIKRIDSTLANSVTISSTSNIDGAGSQNLTAQYQSIGVVSNGTTWYIL